MTPVRIQLSRRKGWQMPSNTVSVARPSDYGNPFVVGRDGTAEECVAKFRDQWDRWLHGSARIHMILARTMLAKLRGKNLACWCKPGAPCHADILLHLANGGDE